MKSSLSVSLSEREIQLSKMNVCGHLLILCVSLLDFRDVFCNEFGHDESSGGDFFKFWRNSKQRRSVKSFGHGRLETGDRQTPQIKPFECGDRVLTVFLRQADVINLQIYEPLGNLLPLNQLAAFCGVSIKTTSTDVRMLFSYDSCYVKHEESEYILSLNWYGTDHVLSCPASVTPPSVVCKDNSMELTVVGDGTADKLSVALKGEWAPLLYVATECWCRKPSNQGELTFLVPYTSCGVHFRGGLFILDLRSKDKITSLSCPYKPIPAFSVKDSRISETTQPLPQKQPSVYQKPPTVFPVKAIDSQIVTQEQAFPVEQQERSASKTHSLHPRGHWVPKLPSLPGSFNLSVKFPFSIPMPTQPVPLRDRLISKSVAPTPAPTPVPTPAPTPAPTPTPIYTSTQQPYQEQMKEELDASVTQAPESQHHYMQYPSKRKFQKPASAPQFEPYSAREYQTSMVPVQSTSLYLPFGSAQNYNVPSPDPLQVNPNLASLAQYLPPGYFICSYNQQPEMFQPPVPNPVQPLQFKKPSYQRPVITLFTPANPADPPVKGYSQKQLTSTVASSPYDSGSQRFQPSQQYPNSYQSTNGQGQDSSTTLLSPTSPLIPTNLQSQPRRYLSYPAFQDARPFHPEYYQKPSQPSESVQQLWSTSNIPVKGLSQESKPLMLASSQTPEYLSYQTGGYQSPDLYQRPVVYTSGIISSQSQYQPSQFSTFPRRPLRPGVISADVYTENTGSSPKGFFQPRSIGPVPSPQTPKFTGNHPITSFPPPMPRFFPVKGGAQVAQLPYSQGPSVRGMRNPHVHPKKNK